MNDNTTITQRDRIPAAPHLPISSRQWMSHDEDPALQRCGRPRGARITDCQRFRLALADAERTAEEPAPLPPITNREMRKQHETRQILAGIALILLAAAVAYTLAGLMILAWRGAL